MDKLPDNTLVRYRGIVSKDQALIAHKGNIGDLYLDVESKEFVVSNGECWLTVDNATGDTIVNFQQMEKFRPVKLLQCDIIDI